MFPFTPEALLERGSTLLLVILDHDLEANEAATVLFEEVLLHWTLDQKRELIRLTRNLAIGEAKKLVQRARRGKAGLKQRRRWDRCLRAATLLIEYELSLTAGDKVVTLNPGERGP
jgi:hypothetical protein